MLRIRKAEYNGLEDKFYAPADDIRNLFIPLVRGALESAEVKRPELKEGLSSVAKTLADYYKSSFMGEDTTVDSIGRLVEGAGDTEEAMAVFLRELALGTLVYAHQALREVTSDPDLTEANASRIVCEGSLLADLPREYAMEVKDILRKSGVWQKELARPKPKGVVKNVGDKR